MSRILRFPRLKNGHSLKGARSEVISSVVEKINKIYEKKRDDIGVSVLGESIFSQPQIWVSSGIIPVDCVVGYGLGFPAGIIEIYGPEQSAKTAVLECTLAAAQRVGYYTGIFPMEYSLDIDRARSVGIDENKLVVFEAETIEDVYDQIKQAVNIIRKKDEETPIVFGWDTIAATPTRSELASKSGLEESDMGKSARQMSKLLRRLVRFLRVNRVCLICINQTRTNLGVMWGSKETTYGGKALRFYAWVRCRMSSGKVIQDKHGKDIGVMCRMDCKKNKFAPPFKHCKVPVLWRKGIDPVRAIWEYCVDSDIFKRKGTSYRFHGNVVTKNKFRKVYLRNKEEIDALMRKSVLQQEEE